MRKYRTVHTSVEISMEDFDDEDIENKAIERGIIGSDEQESRVLAHYLVDNFFRKDFPIEIVRCIETLSDRIMK